MFGRETRMLLRHYLEQGTSKSALARKLGVHRDTIHRWIRAGELDRDLDGEVVRYGPRRPVATKLDAYKPIVEARLAAYPQLSAVRLFDEIRAAGYTGGYSQLKAAVRQLRPVPPPETAKSTLPSSASPGASATRCWWCSGIHGCCGADSVRARTCARC
jgi:transposase